MQSPEKTRVGLLLDRRVAKRLDKAAALANLSRNAYANALLDDALANVKLTDEEKKGDSKCNRQNPPFASFLRLILSGDSQLDLYCEHNSYTAFKCPYACGYISPLPEGEMCMVKCDGQCTRLMAHLDALKKAKSIISAKIKEVEEIINNAD